jgi:putative SOS response-associated peptidase YedK
MKILIGGRAGTSLPLSRSPQYASTWQSPYASFGLMRWGLIPYWAKDQSFGLKTINAMSETAAEKPAFRDAINRCRCLIPADGFFEWKKIGSKEKTSA